MTPEAARALGLERPVGAVVIGIAPRSPAEDAGIKLGEAIVRFGDRPVRDVYALRVLVANARPGTKVDLDVAGDGGARKVAVEVGELPRDAARAAREPRPAESIAAAVDLGISVGELTPELRTKYGIAESERGLVILGVAPDGLAARGACGKGPSSARSTASP